MGLCISIGGEATGPLGIGDKICPGIAENEPLLLLGRIGSDWGGETLGGKACRLLDGCSTSTRRPLFTYPLMLRVKPCLGESGKCKKPFAC